MSFVSVKAKTWFNWIRKEFTGDQYWKWLKASYSKNTTSKSALMTGDLLLIKARLPYQQEEQELNQLAMIVKDPSDKLREAYSLSPSENLFALEANISASNKKEISLLPLQDLLATYKDLYGQDLLYVYRQLELPDRKEKDDETFPGLENWLLALKGKHYAKDQEALIHLILDKNVPSTDSPSLSSQLISATYQEMGLIKKEELYKYLRADFIRQIRHGWEMTRISLLRGAALCSGKMLELGKQS